MKAPRRDPTGAASAYTPGPWHVEADGCNLWIYADTAVVATVPQTPQGGLNARLIVAAPALYSVLTHLLRRPDVMTDPRYQRQIRALLATVDQTDQTLKAGKDAGAQS